MANGKLFVQAVQGVGVEDVRPLAELLDAKLPTAQRVSKETAQMLWKELSYLGSNDIAYLLRGFEGVDYPEVVRDVCKALKVAPRDGESRTAVIANEEAIIKKLFEDAWEQLSRAERRELLREMNLDESSANLGGAVVFASIIGSKAAGFATYRIAVIVANWVARALLGRGLTLGANAALTRGIGVALGPVGWIASGVWLAFDLGAPAMRKTVPAVVIVAAMRQQKLKSGKGKAAKGKS